MIPPYRYYFHRSSPLLLIFPSLCSRSWDKRRPHKGNRILRRFYNEHPVIRCCIAFSDCCLYPTYIENYNAPHPTLSALDVLDFSINVMEPLTSEFASLFKDICDISANLAPIQSTTFPPKAEPHQDELIYSVTTFDGHHLRIPGSKLEDFRKRDSEQKEAYFSQYSPVMDQLSCALIPAVSSFLTQHIGSLNRESFLSLISSISRYSSTLRNHPAIVLEIEKNALNHALSMPMDRFCRYDNNTLPKYQYGIRQDICKKYPFSINITPKKYCSIIFSSACPRNHLGFKAKADLLKLLANFESQVNYLISSALPLDE